MNQALLELDHQELQDSRENQVNQASQEVLDLKELQGHQVFQVYLEVQDQRVTLACQDFKGLLVFLDLRVSMEDQAPQVLPAPLVGQESLADLEQRDCQVTRAKRVVMEFRDHLE